jgi:TctA family transporter
MAGKGRAGAALTTAAVGSFVAGSLATLLIAMFAGPLAELALAFGPPEYFSLMVLGLVASVVLAHGSLLKAICMIIMGLLLGLVGTDVSTGLSRFTFDQPEIAEGISFVAVAMGLFGLGEIVRNLEHEADMSRPKGIARVGSLMPTRDEVRRMIAPIFRGTVLGSLLGILPGGGAMLASFASYSLEKKLSPHPEEFGEGAIEGVAGPESANNAGAQTSFIPMLTLGIPSNAVMALMAGAMIMQGIQPGPAVMAEQPQLFWGMITSMWIGNILLVVLNLPLIGIWVRLLAVPYHLLFPVIVVICAIGAFSVTNSVFDIYLMAGFGVLGYICYKLECEPAPLLLGFILGPMMEEYLRRAMLLARGDFTVFATRPISATLLLISAVTMALVVLPAFRKTREEAFHEED